MKKFKILFLFLLVIIGITVYLKFRGKNFVEDRKNPIINITSMPKGIGLDSSKLVLELSDLESGLDKVVVSLKQRGYKKEIYKEKLLGAKQKNLQINLIPDTRYIVEGEAELEIKVLDRSMQGNKTLYSENIHIDFKKPTISAVTTQHNLSEGGAQLVFYEVNDRSVASSGIKVGNNFFYGALAKNLDYSLKFSNLYAVFYTVSNSFTGTNLKPKLFAEDNAGNYSEAYFYNKVFKRRFPKITLNVSSLLDTNSSKSEVVEKDLLNETYYQNLKNKADTIIKKHIKSKKIFIQNNNGRLWKRNFLTPSGVFRTNYGSILNVKVGSKSTTAKNYSILESGYSLTNSSDTVFSSNSGEVIFADSLPYYNNTIIINHGFGLLSLYGNITKILVTEGEKVFKEQVIAEGLNNSLLGSKTLFYELRLNGNPTEPREWWSVDWYQDHIEDKIKEVKGNYGL